MFDSRQYLKSLEPPEFIAPDGSRFIGRILSMDQWLPFEERVRAAGLGQLKGRQLIGLLRDVTFYLFPRGRKFWTKRFWRPCWWHVTKLPPIGQLRAVYSFMRSQRTALGMKMPPLGKETMDLLGIDGEDPSDASPSAGS